MTETADGRKTDKQSFRGSLRSPLKSQIGTEQVLVRRPMLSFLLSIATGIVMAAFSSSLANVTQNYFISTALVQDWFAMGLVTIFVGALTYLRPEEHTAWGLVTMSVGMINLVFVTGISSTIPLTQLSLTGPASIFLALIAGFAAFVFRPGKKLPNP